MMKKKALSLALALALCLGLTAPALAAGSEFEISDGVLLSYNGNGGSVTIPNGVTEIGSKAFSCNESIISVTIPDSVTLIGEAAFELCSGLTSVTIPDSVTSIGLGAFFHCESLTSITIPDSVTKIDQVAFAGCENLSDISVPEDLTDIGWMAFGKTRWMEDQGEFPCMNGILLSYEGDAADVVLPQSVRAIGEKAFGSYTTPMTSIAIPVSVTHIHYSAFDTYNSLKDIYYGGTEEQWKAIDSDWEYVDSVLGNATIHFNSVIPDQSTTPTDPEQPTDPPVQPADPEQPTDPPVQPGESLAKAGDQNIEIDGRPVAFQTYMLADANGFGTNYVKLRDIAHVLNGTGAQFSVGYSKKEQSISATTGAAYKDTGTEMDTPFAGADKEYVQSDLTIVVNGTPVQLEAITLADDNGGGYNYFKLRDLGNALGFKVGYSNARGVYVETK